MTLTDLLRPVRRLLPLTVGDYSQNIAAYAGNAVGPTNPMDMLEAALTWAGDSLAGTTSDQTLPSHACKGVYLENPSTNSVNLLWSFSSADQYVLTPGSSKFIPCLNSNQVHCKWASGTGTVPFSYAASPTG